MVLTEVEGYGCTLTAAPSPGSLCSMPLCLTCEVDSDSHNDDNDAQDDEGDAEQPCQAPQPPCPIHVPLLHATSRLRREGRETSGSLSLCHGEMEAIQWPYELPDTPHPSCHPQCRTLLQDTRPGGLLVQTPLPGDCGQRTKQYQVFFLRVVTGQGQCGSDRQYSGDQGPERVDESRPACRNR